VKRTLNLKHSSSRNLFRVVLLSGPLLGLLAGLPLGAASAQTASQTTVQRIGLMPLADVPDGEEALKLAIPSAIARALESIDGVVAPAPLELGSFVTRKASNKDKVVGAYGLSAKIVGDLQKPGGYELKLTVSRDGKDSGFVVKAADYAKLVAAADDAIIKALGLKPSSDDQKQLDAVEKNLPSVELAYAAATAGTPSSAQALEAAGNNPWAASARAVVLAQSGKAPEGLELALKAGKAAPLDVNVQVAVGAVQVYAKKFAEAKTTLEAALKLNRVKPEAHFLLGRVVLGTGRGNEAWKEAGAAFGKALSYNPRFLEAGLALADMYSLLGSPQQAVTTLVNLVQRIPDEVTIHDQLLDLFLENDREQAEPYLKDVTTQIVDVPAEVYALAIRLPNTKNALEIIKKGETQYPKSGLLAFSRGLLLERSGQYAPASQAYASAIERDPQLSRASLALASSLAKQGKFAEAERALEKAPSAKDNPKVLARMYLTSGHPEKAAPVLAKITAGTDPEIPYLTGLLAMYEGRFDDAQTAFNASLKIKSDYQFAKRGLIELADARRLGVPKLEGDTLIRYRIGQAARDASNPWEAITAFKAVLEKAPNAAQAQFLLAIAIFETALEPLLAAAKSLPNNPLVLTDLGLVYFQNGRFDLALENLEEAVKADAKYARGWFWLGVTNFQLGYGGPAKAALLKAVGLDSSLKDDAQRYLDSLPK
jgi:tetratricopeptide (TPR) repeat protein